MDLRDCTDYIITKVSDDLSHLKLHKLAYYAQAWHLAIFDSRLFVGPFEAWVHGPVSRMIYDRFNASKFMYSSLTMSDVLPSFDLGKLDRAERAHIDEVLEVYAGFTGAQLEAMTHDEEPWIKARGGLPPAARCEAVIEESVMKRYYRARLHRA